MQAIPPAILDCPVMRAGGYRILHGLVDPDTRMRLLAEAVSRLPAAVACDMPNSDAEEVRGGSPARAFLNTSGGELQGTLYRAPALLTLLRRMTCASLVPSGEAGTYSFYVRRGDFLALHRDIVTCDLAVITCLQDAGGRPDDDRGKLCLYPGRLHEPLSSIRRTPHRGALKLRLAAGQTLVLFGGIIPHALLPVAAGQTRVVSVLCYRIPDPTPAH